MKGIKISKIAKTVLSLFAGYAAEEVMREIVDVAVKPTDKATTKVIKYIGSALVVAAVAGGASAVIESGCDQINNIADAVEELKEAIKSIDEEEPEDEENKVIDVDFKEVKNEPSESESDRIEQPHSQGKSK